MSFLLQFFLVPAHVLSGQVQILLGSLARLLQEAVKKDHSALPVDVEEHACDPVVGQVCAHFVDAMAESFACGHSNGPAELDSLDVLSNAFPIFRRKLFQPNSHRLAACLGAVENYRDSLSALRARVARVGSLIHPTSVPYLVQSVQLDEGRVVFSRPLSVFRGRREGMLCR